MPEELKKESENTITFKIPTKIIQTPQKGSVVIVSEAKEQKSNINPQLIKAIARSHNWNKLLLSGKARNCVDILSCPRIISPEKELVF